MQRKVKQEKIKHKWKKEESISNLAKQIDGLG